jgi:hypothetical protein
MSFDVEKEILNLDKEITEDENQLNSLNILYNKLPKNSLFQKPEINIKESINSLINTSNIITKIDKIKQSPNPKEKLFLTSELFRTEKISNKFLKQYIIESLITEDILKLIEESFLSIKYPIFQGKILMTIFDQLNLDNKSELEIIHFYFELYSYLIIDKYEEFPNFGTVNDLIVKNNENNYNKKFEFIEILSEIIFKKILATIFVESNDDILIEKEEGKIYINKLNPKEKIILYKFEKIILYINKALANTSELISLTGNQNQNQKEINKEKNMNKNLMIKFLLSNLFEKIILFLISEKSNLEINNSSILLIILLVHKIQEQMDEYNSNYQYDSLNNISFYDLIKYYISNTQKEKDIIKGQKKFNENIINKIKENIEMNKTEEVLQNINLMIKDIISLFETFRTYQIFEELLITSNKKIINIFQEIYKNKIDTLFNKDNNILKDNILFTTNLLYNYYLLCDNNFKIFLSRFDLFDENFKNKISKELNDLIKEIKELYNDYKLALVSKIKFEKIISLFNYQNLKAGNDLNSIKNNFNETNEFWDKIKNILDNIQANKELIKSIVNNITKNFVKDLSIIVLNNIEKGNLEGNNLDVLIEKTKFFLENNFMSEDNVEDENKKDILKLYSYLDNLYLNKK